MTISTLTHRDLCEIGAKWCKRTASQHGHGCNIAIVEGCANSENADVIGFRHSTPAVGSVLIEVKVSRSDFLADKKKPHRKNPETGMGKWRYFLCPENLISVEDLKNHPKWGLLYGYPNGRIKVIVGPMANKPTWKERDERLKHFAFDEYNIGNEQVLLIKSLTRFEELDDMIKLQRLNNSISNQSMKLSDKNRELNHDVSLLKNNVHQKLTEILRLKNLLKKNGIDYHVPKNRNLATLFDVHELEQRKNALFFNFHSCSTDPDDEIKAVIADELEHITTILLEGFIEACQMRYKLDLSFGMCLVIKDHIYGVISKETLLNTIGENNHHAPLDLDVIIRKGIIKETEDGFVFSDSFRQFSYSYIYHADNFKETRK